MAMNELAGERTNPSPERNERAVMSIFTQSLPERGRRQRWPGQDDEDDGGSGRDPEAILPTMATSPRVACRHGIENEYTQKPETFCFGYILLGPYPKRTKRTFWMDGVVAVTGDGKGKHISEFELCRILGLG